MTDELQLPCTKMAEIDAHRTTMTTSDNLKPQETMSQDHMGPDGAELCCPSLFKEFVWVAMRRTW